MSPSPSKIGRKGWEGERTFNPRVYPPEGIIIPRLLRGYSSSRVRRGEKGVLSGHIEYDNGEGNECETAISAPDVKTHPVAVVISTTGIADCVATVSPKVIRKTIKWY